MGAEVVDTSGNIVSPQDAAASVEITFDVISGGGRIRSTHSGTPEAVEDSGEPQVSAHKGMARAFVQSTEIRIGSASERELLRKITVDLGIGNSSRLQSNSSEIPPIVIRATSAGLTPATISIPV